MAISMDGKGRWMDNVFVERLWRSVKYEEVYLHAYEGVAAARAGLGRYFRFYNPSAAIRALGAGHLTRCMLTAAHGPRQREAGEPTGAEYTYRTVQLSGSTSSLDSHFRGNDGLKRTISAYGLPSLAVNLSHTLLRSENPVFCAANACMDGHFMQLAGPLRLSPTLSAIPRLPAPPAHRPASA